MLQRVLQLPVVNATCESLQRTYTSTKEAHPLVASVCAAYERGVKGASSLAVWSMEPVVRRLEPQCESGFFPVMGGAGHREHVGTRVCQHTGAATENPLPVRRRLRQRDSGQQPKHRTGSWERLVVCLALPPTRSMAWGKFLSYPASVCACDSGCPWAGLVEDE